MISIKHLSKAYGNNQVLNDLDLHFEKGKVYGIVGENGSGKTTLFKCIAGMENYVGSIHSDFDNLKNHLGFLETNPVFMSRITGWEYLKLLGLARGIKNEDFEKQNIFDLPLGQYAENYSTGMKKKLALMGLLLRKNDIFILDEPFNGVDIHSNMLISAIIKKLKALNKTILISSHIFSTLSDNCDMIHLLKDGKISRTVVREDFSKLDQDMKDFIVGDRLEKLKF
jgi:ABC-2 type transport system ATP-binding protein